MRSDAWALRAMPLVGLPAGLEAAGPVHTCEAATARLSFAGCRAQHRELLSSVIGVEVVALWTLARAQLGLGRLEEANDTLRWAARDHVLVCDDAAVWRLGWLGLDNEWPAQPGRGVDSVSVPDDSKCGARAASIFS